MSDRNSWRARLQADLLAGSWRVVERDAGDVRVEAGPPNDPRPIALVGVLIGDGLADALTRALAEAISQVPGLLRDRQRLDALLREGAGRNDAEDLVLALRAVENDWRISRGLGLAPEIHALTWERVKLALRKAGEACED